MREIDDDETGGCADNIVDSCTVRHFMRLCRLLGSGCSFAIDRLPVLINSGSKPVASRRPKPLKQDIAARQMPETKYGF